VAEEKGRKKGEERNENKAWGEEGVGWGGERDLGASNTAKEAK
jgi:hypothetical protein